VHVYIGLDLGNLHVPIMGGSWAKHAVWVFDSPEYPIDSSSRIAFSCDTSPRLLEVCRYAGCSNRPSNGKVTTLYVCVLGMATLGEGHRATR
jgi:hypothetical protein